MIVVDKPAGMVVHPAAGHVEGTLVNALLFHADNLSGVGGEQRPGIVHRLDRGTSGLMVVAKNDAAHRELTRQFHDREVEKEYIALAWGEVHAGRRIDLPLGRDPVHREKMSTRARRARTAVTRITAARDLRGVTLVHVAIATGRTHQIRVHLSAIGHPIVGDSTYGGVRHRMPGGPARRRAAGTPVPPRRAPVVHPPARGRRGWSSRARCRRTSRACSTNSWRRMTSGPEGRSDRCIQAELSLSGQLSLTVAGLPKINGRHKASALC